MTLATITPMNMAFLAALAFLTVEVALLLLLLRRHPHRPRHARRRGETEVSQTAHLPDVEQVPAASPEGQPHQGRDHRRRATPDPYGVYGAYGGFLGRSEHHEVTR